jgi:hypothetical protein
VERRAKIEKQKIEDEKSEGGLEKIEEKHKSEIQSTKSETKPIKLDP